MATWNEKRGCKLEINRKEIKQEMNFKCLSIEIASYGNVEEEVGEQIAKADDDEDVIRPVITYTEERRTNTPTTKQLLERTAMQIVRRITGNTLMTRKKWENIKQICET